MMQPDQSFYIAVLLFETSSDAPDYRPLYEEDFVLLQSISLEAAQEKALSFGLQQQTSYLNESGATIVWSLKQVVDVQAVLWDGCADGTELYARHFRNYEAYQKFEPLLGDRDAEL